jgi:hypothetical protein
MVELRLRLGGNSAAGKKKLRAPVRCHQPLSFLFQLKSLSCHQLAVVHCFFEKKTVAVHCCFFLCGGGTACKQGKARANEYGKLGQGTTKKKLISQRLLPLKRLIPCMKETLKYACRDSDIYWQVRLYNEWFCD